MPIFDYKKRIIRPVDWIKQPFEDVLRLVSKISYLFIRLIFHKNHAGIENINRLLIIRRNKLGDAISVLPLIQALKEKYPNVTIDVIATPYNEVIFELSKSVNNIYTIPDRYLNNRYLVCFHPQMRKLKHEKNYCLAIGATGSYSSATAWLAFCAPATQRVGVISEKGSIMDLIYNIQIPQKKIIPSIHQVKKNCFTGKICKYY
jgi:ADP-heptose:LPS heptosyltransferase